MSSNQIMKSAEKIAVRDKAFFDSLMDFEKTHKMNTKKRMNFTIDKTLASRFSRLCLERGWNMSRQIENQIYAIIKKHEK